MVTGTIGRLFFISIAVWAQLGIAAQDFVPEWTRKYTPSVDRSARATTLTLAPDGKLIVAGSEQNVDHETDYSFIAYNPGGDALWNASYTSARRRTSIVNALAFDSAGEILATGSSDTIKLDPSGHIAWVSPHGGSSIAADSSFAYITTPGSFNSATLQIADRLGSPVDVILDADPGSDPDDMSDLAILHNLMTRGEVNILGVMGSHKDFYVRLCIQAMNAFYGRTNIPVGQTTSGPFVPINYGWPIWHKYFHPPALPPPVPDATGLYRQILSARPDNSVTIIFTGQLRNLLNVWNSPPDNISALYGRALLARKVKRLIVVAGHFPRGNGPEYNVQTDIEAAMVLNGINTVPITFMGIEQGYDVIIPSRGVGQMHPDNPVRFSHESYGATNRPSWSGLGFLLAARGMEWKGQSYFRSVRGRITINADASNSFVADENANQEYVVRTQGAAPFIEILDDLVLTGPDPSPAAIDSDRTGRPIWSRRFQVTQDWRAEAEFARIDQSGDIFVGGVELNSEQKSRNRFVLHRYGEAGSTRWRTETSGIPEPAQGEIDLRSMHLGNDGVWLFGQYGEGGALFRFNKKGEQLWAYPFRRKARAAAMAVDQNGSAYLAHTAENRIAITRIGSDGSRLNEVDHPIANADSVEVNAVTLDGAGRVLMAGRSSKEGRDSILLVSSPYALSRVSVTEFGSDYPGEARATGVVADSDGHIYLAGYVPTAAGGTEMLAMKLAPAFKMEASTAGGMKFKCYARAGEMVTIEATHDFKTWEHLGAGQSTVAGFLQFEDSAREAAARFYRIIRHK